MGGLMAFRYGRRPKRMPPLRPRPAAKAERRPMAASRPEIAWDARRRSRSSQWAPGGCRRSQPMA